MVHTQVEPDSMQNLHSLGFTLACADPNVWMCDAGDRCKHVMHVDDAFAALILRAAAAWPAELQPEEH